MKLTEKIEIKYFSNEQNYKSKKIKVNNVELK